MPKSSTALPVVGKAMVKKSLKKNKETPLEIFERIQRTGIGVSPEAAEKFNAEVRLCRRASGRKRN